MEYDFIYDIKSEPCKQKKYEMVMKLSDEQFAIFLHMYLSPYMPPKKRFEQYIRAGADLPSETWSMYEIVRLARPPTDEKKLFAAVFKYLTLIEFIYGPKECRKAAKILFKEERVGLTVHEVRKIAYLRNALT